MERKSIVMELMERRSTAVKTEGILLFQHYDEGWKTKTEKKKVELLGRVEVSRGAHSMINYESN